MASELLTEDGLQEAVYATKKAKSFSADAFIDNPGNAHKVSYLCDSLKVLSIILDTLQIRRTETPEAEGFGANKAAGEKASKYLSISTSRDILGHAARRPDK